MFGLITRTTSVTSDVRSRLEAAYLAQEGLELVRNLRDANFLAIQKNICNAHAPEGGGSYDGWKCWAGKDMPTVPAFADLTQCASGCEIDYNDSALQPYGDNFLYINNVNGFYSYDTAGATQTPCKRKITITRAATGNEWPAVGDNMDKLAVTVEVSWPKGKVTNATDLYNWLELSRPVRFGAQLKVGGSTCASGSVVPPGTSSVQVSFDTNRSASCRFKKTEDLCANSTGGVSYEDMTGPGTGTFTATGGGTEHKETETGLSNGDKRCFFIRCQGDVTGPDDDPKDVNTSDYTIGFSVANLPSETTGCD